MWTLWFFPLVLASFLVGAAIGAIWFFASAGDRRPNILAVAGVPIGCAALPIVGFALLAALGAHFQGSDTQLYEEVFGYRPTITEDRVLFDDFGSGNAREFFMRAEPTDAERRRLLAIPGARESEFSLRGFIARGQQYGFNWWMSADPLDLGYCKSARIIDAPGFRGWTEFRVAECLDAGTEFPASANARYIYVVASRRGG